MEDKKNDNHIKKAWWQPAMAFFLRMSAWIGVPVVIAAFFGKWFDSKYGTDPWGLLSIIGFSFIISMIGIVRQVSREYKKIEFDAKNKK